ncbi:hypothetical protein JW916_08600 [Candidatus Sumerlaeota bacterium]|nr:hypothetical protein [Candidatus Sumerlaeota bacterium]
MEVEIFALCDAAADYGGKLNLLGTFDTVRAQQFPTARPHCAVALRMRFERVEEGEHRIRINFVDGDGKPIIPNLDSKLTVRFPPEVSSVCANMVLAINGMKFDRPGHYSIDLGVDGRYEKSLPIHVVQAREEKDEVGRMKDEHQG